MARLYSNLKFLRYTDRLEALAKREVAAPVHVRIKPINRCNHSCWYCAYRAGSLQLGSGMDEQDVLPEAKMFEIADDLVAMGVKAVTFSGGGEPLIYKPLPAVIGRLAAGGIRVAALTNGANLKGRVAEAFGAHGTWIRVSVDGWDDASYAQARGVREGDFSRLLANMRAFVGSGTRCVLGVSFIVSRENHDHVLEACRLFKDAGARHVKVTGAVVANDMAANNAYHRTIMNGVGEQIALAKAELNRDGFEVVDHYHELEELFEKPYTFCPFLQFLTVIGADGMVYTCQDKAYTTAGRLGSIRERSFREFWFSDENRARLYGLNPSTDCQHHCIAHLKNLSIMEYLSIDPDHSVFV